MSSAPVSETSPAIQALDAAASSARGGFACMFSTSDEFESAFISQRRAQGRYQAVRSRAPIWLFAGCALTVMGIVLLFA